MKRLYAILDIQSKMIIGGVHVFPQDAAAIRFFRDLVGDPQTMMGRHPNDHNLLMLASFDDEDGSLLTDGCPSVVVSGSAMAESIRLAKEAQERNQS